MENISHYIHITLTFHFENGTSFRLLFILFYFFHCFFSFLLAHPSERKEVMGDLFMHFIYTTDLFYFVSTDTSCNSCYLTTPRRRQYSYSLNFFYVFFSFFVYSVKIFPLLLCSVLIYFGLSDVFRFNLLQVFPFFCACKTHY